MTERITIRETIRIRLEELSDPEYQGFRSRLLPGITGAVGVRTSVLRGITRDLKKNGQREYVEEASDAWERKGQGTDGVLYGEMIIWGLCIYGGCHDWDTAREYMIASVPAINSWAVCNILCGSLKIVGHCKEEVQQFIQPYFQSGGEYDLHLGVVILLSHYTGRVYLERVLKLLDGAHHTGYYAKMAAARALSAYFVKLPDQIMERLKQSSPGDWAYNKASQRITESFHVDREAKKLMRQIRRGC